jgi:uncharacterized protein
VVQVIALFGSVLLMSLLGSLHCAAMCGGLVGFVVGSGRRPVAAQLLYHLGRWCAYATLGLGFGWLGQSVDWLGSAGGLANTASLLAALLMVSWGIARLLPVLGFRRGTPTLRAPKRRLGSAWFQTLMHRASTRSPAVRSLALGLLTGMLPCGWLYVFVLMAAGTGSAASGLAVMTAFWLGGIPALFGVSLFVEGLARTLGKRAPVFAAVALMLGGLGTLGLRTWASPTNGDPGATVSCPVHGTMSIGGSK